MSTNRLSHLNSSAIAIASAAMFLVSVGRPAWGQQRTANRADSVVANQANANDRHSHEQHSEHTEQESSALGVIVGSCPGNGVCVEDTIWASPAHEAGIQQGDFILSVDGKKVASPKELIQMVEKLEAGKQVTLGVWRQGQEMNKQIVLAARAKHSPASHKAWLGVMLVPAPDGGVTIERVLPDSPAAEAGLRNGDTIIKQGEEKISDIRSFVESVEDSGPGAQLQLSIRRGDKEQKLSVKLAHVHEAPIQFLRHIAAPPMDDSPMNPGQYGFGNSSELIDETLNEMRREIRDLQRQVNELIGEKKGENEGRVKEAGDDLSRRSNVNRPNGTMLVVRPAPPVHLDDRRPNPNDFNRARRGYNNYNRNPYNGNPYGRNPYNRNLYGGNSNSDWRNRYQPNPRLPLNRSPQYGNSYYRYGGQSYYGNPRGGSGYGRSGIQFGNVGIYWY